MHNHFLLPNRKKKTENILYSDILYLEGNINYTFIHLQNGKIKVSPRTLLFHIHNSLDDNFIRIHRAFCMNRSYIQDHDHESLLLTGGMRLAVARRRKGILAGV